MRTTPFLLILLAAALLPASALADERPVPGGLPAEGNTTIAGALAEVHDIATAQGDATETYAERLAAEPTAADEHTQQFAAASETTLTRLTRVPADVGRGYGGIVGDAFDAARGVANEAPEPAGGTLKGACDTLESAARGIGATALGTYRAVVETGRELLDLVRRLLP